MPHVTLLYGSLLALLILALGLNVSRVRGKTGTWFDNTPPPMPLFMAIRAHANAVEWSLVTLFVMLLVELGGGDSRAVHVAGGTLLAGRLFHAVGLLSGVKVAAVGSTLTYVTLFSTSAWGVWLHFMPK